LKNILLFSILFSQLLIGLSFAQIKNNSTFFIEPDSSKIVKITFIDSTFSIGTILNESDTSVLFQSSSDLIFTVRTDHIKEINYAYCDSVVNKHSINNSGNSRLFFSPTARILEAGKGYFSVHEIFFPFISMVVVNNFELDGGISIYPEGDKNYYFLGSKFQFYSSKNITAAAGLAYLGIFNNSDVALLGYGIVTLGNEEMGVTLGYGSNLLHQRKNDLSGLFIVGGDILISDFVKIISENYLLLEGDKTTVVYSSGVRFFGKNLAADIGFFGAIDSSKGWPFLPWISFSYNF